MLVIVHDFTSPAFTVTSPDELQSPLKTTVYPLTGVVPSPNVSVTTRSGVVKSVIVTVVLWVAPADPETSSSSVAVSSWTSNSVVSLVSSNFLVMVSFACCMLVYSQVIVSPPPSCVRVSFTPVKLKVDVPFADVQSSEWLNESGIGVSSVIVRGPPMTPDCKPVIVSMASIVGSVAGSVSSEKSTRPLPVVVKSKTVPCISVGSVIFLIIILPSLVSIQVHLTFSPALSTMSVISFRPSNVPVRPTTSSFSSSV